jgi:hypothetical protein
VRDRHGHHGRRKKHQRYRALMLRRALLKVRHKPNREKSAGEQQRRQTHCGDNLISNEIMLADDDNYVRETYTTFFSPRFFSCGTFWKLASLPTPWKMQSGRLNELRSETKRNETKRVELPRGVARACGKKKLESMRIGNYV